MDISLRKQHFSSSQERIDFSNTLYLHLKKIPFKETIDIVKSVLEQFNDVQQPEKYMMNWDDIRQLQAEGHLINSHTKSHPFLAQIKDDTRLEEELLHSMDRIETECGVKPRSISYPVGNYDERVKQKSRECGYELGLAVNQTFFETDSVDMMEIPRVDIYAGSGWLKTYFRLSGQLESIKKLIRG